MKFLLLSQNILLQKLQLLPLWLAQFCILKLIITINTMQKHDSEKVFDGSKFVVWKFHIEIYLEEKSIMKIVDGTTAKPLNFALDLDKEAWQKVDNLVRRMIDASVTLLVLENLNTCIIVACMWSTLCAFYQHKSKENIYMVQNNFFEYKMDMANTINTHVNKVVSMGYLLKALGQPIPQEMLITKIVCSLPPSYNSILAAWANVPALEQTVANLKVKLLQMKTLMNMQGGDTSRTDKVFFIRTSQQVLPRSWPS